MIATTLPIKFSDVCLELYGNSSTVGKSLSQAFIDATGDFDVTYEGSKDRLTNFRGYDHTSYTPVTFTLTDFSTSGLLYTGFGVSGHKRPQTFTFKVESDVWAMDNPSQTITILGETFTGAGQTKTVTYYDDGTAPSSVIYMTLTDSTTVGNSSASFTVTTLTASEDLIPSSPAYAEVDIAYVVEAPLY